jgi:hypothetical protein
VCNAHLPLVASGNRSYHWDGFDPDWYVRHNYSHLRDDDRRIMQLVRDFFGEVFDPDRPVRRGIDVGSGPNLYPALTMLPFCGEVTLLERGANNVRWLRSQMRGYSPVWDDYWNVLAKRPAYGRIADARKELSARTLVRSDDMFRLPQRRWDVGTMFFVAESISDQEREFKAAVERFIGSLRPGAPFAAAFMRDSAGYYVDRLRFPAVAVREVDVEHCLAPHVDGLVVQSIRSEKPLRDGYHGMILALGRAGKTRA